MCLEKNKEGLFLLNDKTTPQDVSFHYFFCNIDFFFNKFQHVKNENDYRAFLQFLKFLTSKLFQLPSSKNEFALQEIIITSGNLLK